MYRGFSFFYFWHSALSLEKKKRQNTMTVFFFLNKVLSWKYLHCTCQKISHLKSKDNSKDSDNSFNYKTVGKSPDCKKKKKKLQVASFYFFPSDPQSSSDSSRSSTTSSPPSASSIRAEDDIGWGALEGVSTPSSSSSSSPPPLAIIKKNK